MRISKRATLRGGLPLISLERRTPGQQRVVPAKNPQRSQAGFRRYWYLLAVAVMLLFAFWPGPGLVIAGLFSGVGVVMVLIGGIYPFLRVIFSAPGTVLTMLLSRSARFEMMNAPDNHPYKVLMRTAFDPTRGLFWKGVLLIVMFIPAAIINSNIGDVFKNRGADPAPNPNLVGPGQQPVGVPPQAHPAGENPDRPGFPPQGGFRASPRGGSDRVFLYDVTFTSFTGNGSAEEAARSALKTHPGFNEESLKVDDEAKTMAFQIQGGMGPIALSRLLAQHGFPSTQIKMSSK